MALDCKQPSRAAEDQRLARFESKRLRSSFGDISMVLRTLNTMSSLRLLRRGITPAFLSRA